MKVGSLVFATDQGLGILARDFYDNGIVTDVMVVAHGRRPEHMDWYPGAGRISSLGHDGFCRAFDFLKGMDMALFFETPFIWPLLPALKERGVKTAICVMYECMPDPLPHLPDLILNPSLLDQQYYPNGIYLPVPVNTDKVQWRQRTKAEVFVHNAGHGGLKGRNGTAELLEALRYVQSPARFLIRSQEPLDTQRKLDALNLRRAIEVQTGTVPYNQLFAEGDVLVHPHKFDGLSLPLQEARAAGMLVMSTDRFPDNTWLPADPLIPQVRSQRTRLSPRLAEIDEAVIDPKAIAAKIDQWYGADISAESVHGREWAQANNWQALKPKYLEVLQSLLSREKP